MIIDSNLTRRKIRNHFENVNLVFNPLVFRKKIP